MLWRIRDFKGLRSAELDIRQGKATILTGVNSSGKSSVIQSLLLAAQSLHGENEMVLNGPLVRLGDAYDLARDGAENGAIELTVGLGNDSAEEASEEGSQAIFDLVPAEDLSTLQMRRLRIGSATNEKSWFEMGLANARAIDVNLAMEATSRMGPRRVLHLKSLLHSDRRQLRTYIAVKGLRPVAVVQLMTPEQVGTRYRALLDVLLQEQLTGSTNAASKVTARIGGASFIREFVRLISGHDTYSISRGGKFFDARMGNPYAFERAWESISHTDRKMLVDRAVETRQERPYIVLTLNGHQRRSNYATGLLEGQLADQLGSTLDILHSLTETLESIEDRVQYLGPLRDEPRVVWNHWNELIRGLPVGTRGEYSAAVLSRSSSQPVMYASPESATATVAPLSTAVNEWLAYLDIGEAVAARSHGKLGVGLDLRVNDQVRDLTSVGVGVSQALPLLVGLLTSPYGSIFIVEQPELHLHPSVQARLADFMLSARPDLTLIVETHSESFITRIRRRAAEGRFNNSDIDIIFVEPSGNGSTTRILEVSEFGDLSEWPKGFLSAAEDDIRAILKANLERSLVNKNAN